MDSKCGGVKVPRTCTCHRKAAAPRSCGSLGRETEPAARGVRGPRPLQPQRGRAGALRASEGGGPSASAGHAEHAHGAPLCHPDQKQRPARAPRGCLGAGRGTGGSGSGDRWQFVGAHPHTWEVRARWCVQRARDGSRELGPQGCGNRRRRPNGRRASDKCPRRVVGPSSPPGRRRAARGAPAECRSRGPWRGRAGASPCRVPARPPRGFLSAQHVPRRAHALSPVLSSARRGSRLSPCRVPSSQHGAWRHRWPAGLDSRSGRRVDGAALSASRRSSRLFQNANSCPVDRTVFKCICIRACYGGKILKKVSVRAAPPGAGAHDWCVRRGETCARQGDTGMAAPRSPVLRPPHARAAVRSRGSRERHGHGRPGLGQEAGLLGPGLSECAAAAMGRAGRRRGHAPSPFSACVCNHAETRKACVGPCCRGPEAHPGSHECRRARLGAVGLPLH